MVMGGKQAVLLKCESCCHEEVKVKRSPALGGLVIAWLMPCEKKCSECGGRMIVDKGRTILF